MEMCGDSTSKGIHFDDFGSARKIIVCSFIVFLKLLLHKRSFNVDVIVGALNDCSTPYTVITENTLACTEDEECYTIS